MIRALVGFELLRRLKVVSTYVYALLLFAAGFFMMLAAGGTFSSVTVSTGNERVLINGPHSLISTIGVVALFGLFTVAAIFGQAAYQDFGHNTWPIIFTKNVKKTPYLVGRFLGAFVFSAVLFLSIGFGQLLGTIVVHFLHPEMLGRTSIAAYLWPYITLVWPMLFFTGALFFSLAAITRRMAPVYVGAVVLVLGYLLTMTLVQDVDNRAVAALADPFGFGAYSLTTRYWTPAEQNRDLAPVLGLFGANRVLWSLVGVALLGGAIQRFRTTVDEHRGRGRDDEEASKDTTPFPTTRPAPSTSGWARAALGFGWLYFKEIVRSAVFWALIVSAVFFGTVIVLVSKSILGTATMPVTYQALELTKGAFRLFSIIIVTFYAGELVWRERDVQTNDIFDATRAPTWVGYVAKVGALFLVALSIEGATAVVALVSQISRGYFAIEGRLYLTELLLIDFTGAGLACVLALVVQVLVNHKYIGHAVMVLYYILNAVLSAVGVEDPLARYGSDTPTRYSDMNGYGHLLGPFAWFRVYWWGFALALCVVGYVFFVRGRETTLRTRFDAGRKRVGVAGRLVFASGLVVFVGAGSVIFYNTHILNKYETEKDQEKDQALYEKTYKAELAKLPQPSIIGADTSFDIFPEARRIVVKGTYKLENKGKEPVTKVALNLPDSVVVRELRIGPTKAAFGNATDDKLSVRWVSLPEPLAPAARADLVFDLLFEPKGFAHGGPKLAIVGNGTFVNNGYLPTIGYQEHAELESDRDRKRYDLAPKERMAPRDDPAGLAHNYIRQDSDFITFATTVSTSPDQIAMAPGYLEREWTENDRRYFRYVMDQPILNFFSVLSGRYEVKRDEWNGVKLEILHHGAHTKNLDRMMQGMKDALAYCSEAFGPYQHRQARILEFPRYQSFAQSFPNTIPYSEAIGFIARVRDDDPDDVDYPYYVTAHEIAHQWWAHQVVGANVRGATMTSESMAQYSALMVMKKKYGKERMRRFLKFELDGYLRGRFGERKKELPLAHNENQQYIHYQKGSVAMYALQDYIGEERVNRALARVVSAWRMKGPPYATAKDLVDAFRVETPPEYQYLIDDLFETITLYDNRAVSAKVVKNAEGGFEVTLKVFAKKVRSDDKGDQTDLDFDDFIDVGALDDKGTAIFVEKRKIKKGESEVRFVVPKKPAKVGIDPLNELIDRDSDDNVTVPSF
jgi:ABC-2 type transport system permease protein